MLAALVLQAASLAPQIRGRVLHEDGSPAMGAELTLAAQEARRLGDIPPWRTLTAFTDFAGRFELTWLPTRWPLMLTAHEIGYERAAWQWTAGELDCPIDLGDVVLQPGATIHGRVLDSERRPMKLNWRVWIWARSRVGGESAGFIGLNGLRAAPGGEFWATDLPAGRIGVGASRVSFGDESNAVAVEAGDDIECDVAADEYSDVVAADFVPVSLEQRGRSPAYIPAFGQASDFGHWILSGPVKMEFFRPPPNRLASCGTGADSGVAFGELEPGRYRFEVDDPRFEPCSTTFDVPCDDEPVLCMQGTSAMQVLVRDAATGAQIRNATLELRAGDHSYAEPNDFDPIVLREAWDEWPQGNVFKDIVAGSWRLSALAPGYGPVEVEVCSIAPRETRFVEVDLAKLGRIRGRVVYADGTPLDVPCVVTLIDPQPLPHAHFSAPWTDIGDGNDRRHVLRQVLVDAGSEFRIDDAPAGHLPMRVDVARDLSVRLPDVEVRPGETGEVRVVLEPCAWLDGHVAGVEGYDGCGIRLKPYFGANYDPLESLMRASGGGAHLAPVARDGSFHVGPVRPGPYVVTLTFPDSKYWMRNGGGGWSSTTPQDLGVLYLDAGTQCADLRASVGDMTVILRAAGRALPYVRVVLCRNLGQLDGPYGMTDALGQVHFTPLAAGHWNMSVCDLEARWSMVAPEEIEFAPGAHVSIDVDLPLVRRTVRFIDKVSSRPLKQVGFSSNRRHEDWFASSGLTNNAGEAVLELPAGNREFRLQGIRKPHWTCAWSESLPEPVIVALAP